MAAVLVIGTIVLAMMWSGSYESSPDPVARFEVEAVRLERDRGFVWLEAHLKKSGDQDHDLRQPVRLVTADGAEHEPADTTFAGSPETGFTEVWFKFWLEKEALAGELDLKLNGGVLKIKNSQPVPAFGQKAEIVYQTADWERSWLGF